VRAEIVNDLWVYWSSVQAHITGVDDKLIKVTSYLKPLGIGDNSCYSGIYSGINEKKIEELCHTNRKTFGKREICKTA
jgi:hypothetical protein